MLPRTPTDALLELTRLIARPSADNSCWLLDEAGQRAFATAHEAPNCAAALRVAHAELARAEAYDRITLGSVGVEALSGGEVAVDGCGVQWRPSIEEMLYGESAAPPQPGPPPGRIIVAPAYGRAWRITDYQPC
jgi:hypothetical protein